MNGPTLLPFDVEDECKKFFFLKSCLKKKADAVVGQNDNLGFHLSIFYLCASLLKAQRQKAVLEENLAKIFLFWERRRNAAYKKHLTASFCAPCNFDGKVMDGYNGYSFSMF